MKFLTAFILFVTTCLCHAAESKVESLPELVARFSALYPKAGENLLADIRIRLTQKSDPVVQRKLEEAETSLAHLKTWAIRELRKCAKYPKEKLPLADALHGAHVSFSSF